MERKRKQKILMIIVLIISIASVSIGFAAFSSILTISSSATVTPTDDSFVLNMYGFTGEDIDDFYNFDKYTSTTFSKMLITDRDEQLFVLSDKIAMIDHNNFSLNLGEVEIKSSDEFHLAAVKIENKGNYDVYFNTLQLENYDYSGICIPNEGTSSILVDEACQYIGRNIFAYTQQSFLALEEYYNGNLSSSALDSILRQDCFYYVHLGNENNRVCKLAKGEKVVFGVGILYDFEEDEYGNNITPMADGPFTVSFPDIKLEFTTDSTGYVED